LTLAKTVFGRHDADVALDDPAISSQHFQIEAFGREFFLRDLDSRNGTFLNGSQVRYSQVLPGDQITAGKTSLIFRLSDDRIDRI
jgi:pSer/pThr/pTyr-binding forkhead associated (FHA) protein